MKIFTYRHTEQEGENRRIKTERHTVGDRQYGSEFSKNGFTNLYLLSSFKM